MSSTGYVTRRVIESRTYEVFAKEGNELKLLDTIDIKGKVSEKNLAIKYGVSKVFVEEKKVNKAVYAMKVDEFMQYAKKLESEDEE